MLTMNRLKKAGAVFVILIINLLVFGIIALNVFVIWKDFPQWIMILAAMLDIAVVLLIAKKVFAGKAAKIIAVSITSVFAVLCVLFAYACPYWNSDGYKLSEGPVLYYENSDLTKKEALADLEEVMDYLRKYHISFVDGLTPEVQAKYDEVKADFESKDTVTKIEFTRGVKSILHEIYDAHTYFNTWNSMYLSDGPEMKSKGYSIYSVNGITEDGMKELIEPYASYETPRHIFVDMEDLFYLDLCGVEAPYEVVWKTEDGDEESRTYNREDFITCDEYYVLEDKYLPSDNNDYVYYEIDEEKSLAILTLKRCRISEHYREVLRDMFTEIKEKNIENLAIDLRGNGGGDTYVINELFKYLPVDTYYQGDNFRKIRWNFLTFDQSGVTKNKRNAELEFDGKLYVLTDEASFSAAMIFAEMIVDNDLGKVIGESPSEACNCCTEITQFYFDDIGMWFSVSTVYHTRIDPSNGDYIEPDYPCSGEEAIDTLYDIVG
jgi:hypothetical protein